MSLITPPFAGVHGESIVGLVFSQTDIHLAIGSSESCSNKFLFQDGDAGSITAIADGGGGELEITAAGHDLSIGEYVSLVGGTGYAGIHRVNDVDGDDFEITGVFGSTGTGTYIRGINFTALGGSAGKHEAGGGFTGRNSTGGARFEFYIIVNDVAQIVFGRTFSNSVDTGNAGTDGSCIDIAVGDKISFGFANLSGTSNIDQDVLDIIVKRISR